ncbi:MAG: hypothetical protein KC418_03395 [Anaerolineales bacterium]|nr:hypothetical protein [Anaerolineales bacterium]MCB8951202.1 hypothetical protein [Ardenticatenales bacterium]
MFPEFEDSSLPAPTFSALRLGRDPNLPVPLRGVNQLSAGMKRRLLRLLIPPNLLTHFRINPISWENPAGEPLIDITAEPGEPLLRLVGWHEPGARDPFYMLELVDNIFNGLDVNLLVLSDPHSPRYYTDRGLEGRDTLFGTIHRNLVEEERAMLAGLAPAQIRLGLRASRLVMQGIEWFAAILGHPILYLEPLTYLDAWLFERRGCGYISGRRLMEKIHVAFQPGEPLHAALDGSTPFRQPGQWRTVRGRAWAIHDGILATIGESWNGVRMAKRVGYMAGMDTFPGALY